MQKLLQQLKSALNANSLLVLRQKLNGFLRLHEPGGQKRILMLAGGLMACVFLMLGTLRFLVGGASPEPTEVVEAATEADQGLANQTQPNDSPTSKEEGVVLLDLSDNPDVATTNTAQAAQVDQASQETDTGAALEDTASLSSKTTTADESAADRATERPSTNDEQVSGKPLATATKPVSSTTEATLPFEILDVAEQPAPQEQTTAVSAQSPQGVEVLNLEGTSTASKTVSTSTSGQKNAENQGDAESKKREQAKLRRFRRIEATLAQHPEDLAKARKYGMLLTRLGEFERGEKFFLWFLKLHPEDTDGFYHLGEHYEHFNKWEQATKAYRRVAELDSKHESSRLRLARILAACPDDSVRSGAEAVMFAQEANNLQKWPTPEIADVLASAYAEAGDFRAALRVQRWAIRSAPMEARVAMLQRLELYRRKQPYRM